MDNCFDCKINKRITLEEKIKENDNDIIYEYTSYFCEGCYKNYPDLTAIEIFNQMKTKKCVGCELNERFLIKFSNDKEIYENYSFFCKYCLDELKLNSDEINYKIDKESELDYFPQKITRSINFKPKIAIKISKTEENLNEKKLNEEIPNVIDKISKIKENKIREDYSSKNGILTNCGILTPFRFQSMSLNEKFQRGLWP